MYSVIITDYRTIENTVKYIECFYVACENNVHFIVVDNSERQDGLLYLQKNNISYRESFFKNKTVYEFEKNLIKVFVIDAACNGGYAKGNNLGALYAKMKFNDQYYIFSNTDLKLPTQFSLSTLSNYMVNNSKIGIIGPNIITSTGQPQNPRKNRGIVSQMILWDINVLVIKNYLTKWLWNLDEKYISGESDWVSGCFLFVRASAFWQIDGFDENTFLYAEEMIISKRMLAKGYVTYYVPELTIIHQHQGTSSYKTRKILHKSKRYYYANYTKTNMLLLMVSDWTYYFSEIILWVKHELIANKFKKIIGCLKNGKYNKNSSNRLQ